MQGIKVLGQGPVVVLLHSSLSSNKQWLPLCHALQEHFTLINIDLKGYGNAPLPKDLSRYTFDEELARIDACLSKQNITETVHLVGHSCGGAIAMAWAMKNTHKVASLALFEPVAFHLLEHYSPQHFQQVCEFAEQLATMNNGQSAQAFVNFWNGEQFFQLLPLKVQQQMANAMPKVHADFRGILHEQYLLGELAQLTCPCLVMIGKQTQPLSKVLSQAITEQLTDVTLVNVPYGHMTPVSHPKITTEAISTFLFRFL
ncbi:alpha/beta fold hydrolase [Thalassotalea sediminis]|uniref:alpha/beta fold hydrolase n=1 Tax=Thalassotalea sediminis TaxID=1759089 RepID=UPI0025722E1C|nr:alpha/beta hydrolase [Thalassotalea sediminis]